MSSTCVTGEGPYDGAVDYGAAIMLGALQGLTEFLPVSSDGHLALGAMLLGLAEMPLPLVVLLHAGTLVATLAIFGGDALNLAKATISGLRMPTAFLATDQGRIVAGVVIASIPTAVIGLAIEDRVESWASSPVIVGLCLWVSAAAVLSTRRRDGKRASLGMLQYALLGMAQGVAVLPGVSRSGMTIAMGMLLGLSGPEAFRFSFLLSLPAVAGAVLLELRHAEQRAAIGLGGLLATTVAMVVGYGALLLLRRVVQKGRVWAFGLYLLPLGLAALIWGWTRG